MNNHTLKTVSIGEAANILHVSPATLRRYEDEHKLDFKVIYTAGGHRKYPLDALLKFKDNLLTQKQDTPLAWFPADDAEDKDLDISELYDKYTFIDNQGASHLPKPAHMPPRLFAAEYDFMAFADLESPQSYEWLAQLREEQARRLEFQGMGGANQERYHARKLRQQAFNYFGIDACKDIISMSL